MLADHAHVRLFGIGVLEAVGEPVRHAVAEHQHVALRNDGVVALLRRRRLGEILDPPRRLLLEWREQVAAEPAAIIAAKAAIVALWRLPLRRPAEIKKLGGSRPHDPDQHGDRNGQRDQRAAFGEHPEKGLLLGHAARRHGSSEWIVWAIAIIAESGRKRADSSP